MKHREKAYHWWKRKPSSVRKPLVLTLGSLLVIISPFTGILPGPGGIPIFLLGIAILASEYQWAEKLRLLLLKVLPDWVKKYWQLTPKWLYFIDCIGLLIIGCAVALSIWRVYLPVIEMRSELPFFFVAQDVQQQWWIPALICAIAGLSILLLNRNRTKSIKRLLRRIKA